MLSPTIKIIIRPSALDSSGLVVLGCHFSGCVRVLRGDFLTSYTRYQHLRILYNRLRSSRATFPVPGDILALVR